MEARLNERVKEDLDTLYKARRVTHVSGISGAVGTPGPSSGRTPRRKAGSPYRQSLVGAIKTDILPVCREALVSRGDGVNDNTDPIRLPALRIASMAAGGAAVSEIYAYLRSQPLSTGRKADLLEIAARRIGEGWACENLDFVDVTVAVGRLQSTFRRLHQDCAALSQRRNSGSALVLAAPGDEHVFGMFFVEELFRTSGWSTTMAMPAGPEEWLKCATSRPYDVICISWATECLGEPLARCIAAAKQKLQSKVVCGGYAAALNADRLRALGVDLVSGSPQAALDFSRRNLLKRNQSETSEAQSYGG
jgi:methylmalonyl-CoA mutase cobalamin-binding subunit